MRIALKKANKLEKCKEEATMIREYKEIIKTKKEHYMHCLWARYCFQKVQKEGGVYYIDVYYISRPLNKHLRRTLLNLNR